MTRRLTRAYVLMLVVIIGGAFLFFPACTKSTPKPASVAQSSSQNDETRIAGHNWDSISYPDLPPSPPGLQKPALSIRRHDDGLVLHLEYSIPAPEDGRENGLPSEDKIAARLHTGSGKITESIPDEQNGTPGLGYMNFITYPYSFRIPWGPNVMEEAWIELRLPDQLYWIEVPYGFTRNPANQLTPDEEKHGPLRSRRK